MSSDTVKIDIINLALAHFTQTTIVTLSEDTVARIAATTIFDEIRDRLLVDYPWNFAIKRKTLTPPAEQTPTSIAYSGTTATVTKSTHGYSTDMYVRVAGANESEYNGDWQITVTTANAFTYTMDDTPTANASGTLTIQHVPGFEYDYHYALPSDYLRLLELYDPPNLVHAVENGYILCDEDEKILIKYIRQITDYTLWPVAARQCLATALAMGMMPKIRGVSDVNTRVRLQEELEREILRAYTLNAIEGNPNIPKDMQGMDKGNYSWQTER